MKRSSDFCGDFGDDDDDDELSEAVCLIFLRSFSRRNPDASRKAEQSGLPALKFHEGHRDELVKQKTTFLYTLTPVENLTTST